MTMTKGQQEFLDQYTRKLMVDICAEVLAQDIPEDVHRDHTVYTNHAISKKWLSYRGTLADRQVALGVLSSGWATAARFLKR